MTGRKRLTVVVSALTVASLVFGGGAITALAHHDQHSVGAATQATLAKHHNEDQPDQNDENVQHGNHEDDEMGTPEVTPPGENNAPNGDNNNMHQDDHQVDNGED
jgi:hypothetical protein